MRRRVLSLMSLLLLSTPASPGASEGIPKEEVAARAIVRMSQEMRGKLSESIKKNGPAGAIDVCALEAPGLAERIEKEMGVALKRTSLKLRNPQNAPDQAEKRVLNNLESLRRAGKPLPQGVTAISGESNRYFKVILVEKPCLQCHGDQATISEPVRKELSATYPKDEAVGYKEGEIRGIISVLVKK